MCEAGLIRKKSQASPSENHGKSSTSHCVMLVCTSCLLLYCSKWYKNNKLYIIDLCGVFFLVILALIYFRLEAFLCLFPLNVILLQVLEPVLFQCHRFTFWQFWTLVSFVPSPTLSLSLFLSHTYASKRARTHTHFESYFFKEKIVSVVNPSTHVEAHSQRSAGVGPRPVKPHWVTPRTRQTTSIIRVFLNQNDRCPLLAQKIAVYFLCFCYVNYKTPALLRILQSNSC